MYNPYLITEPTCISFSGGRTSGYMLYKILEAHDMSLPSDAIVCFANTGKECEETLEFVRDCGKNWGVDIHWLEYVYDKEPSKRHKRVTFETASRNGEPFAASIDQNGKPYLPNPVARICTINLKIRVIDKYLKSLGWQHNEKMDWVGIRADEQRRAAKIDRSRLPLVTAGVTKKTVGDFWKEQSFDLNLPNVNGVTMHGNCDLCFLKPANQVFTLIQEKPERAIWWMNMEKLTNQPFRQDRPTYSSMLQFSKEQIDMFNVDEETIACFCGD